MRIGIDIDDTLTETKESFFEIIKKYNIDLKKSYDECLTVSYYQKLSNHMQEALSNVKFKKGVKKAIKKLKENHELYILTARDNKYCENIEVITHNLFEENKLCFDGIYFGQEEKADLAKKLNLDLMIDDSTKVYNNMKEENIDCILFGDKIKTWEQVLKYINEKEENHG